MDPIIHVKDGLRRLRYRVRQAAAGEGEPTPPLPPLPQPLALVADSMLSVVAAAREALTPESEPESHKFRGALPIRHYVELATGSRGNVSAFTSLAYHAFKIASVRFGAREALVSELALERARRNFADHLRQRTEGGHAQASRTMWECAALAVAFARAQPMRRVDFDERRAPARHFVADANLFVAFAIALSACVAPATREKDLAPANDPLVLAEAAIDTYFPKLKNALLAPDPVAAVAAEFERIVSFL
jgi:hypothetical protein